MKKLILSLAFITASYWGCKDPGKNEAPKPETPKALQENNSNDYSIGSKRSYRGDLVEELYAELVTKTRELKDMEDQIVKLTAAKNDSLKTFREFDQKNNEYYSAAHQHLVLVKDSLLRSKIEVLIKNSQDNYSTKTAKYNSLISQLDSKNLTLQGLHTILKIVKTLPLIEKYQHENMPGIKPGEKVINDFDKTIRILDSLAKQ